LPSPGFFFHGEEDPRKGIDTERRLLEPLECGHYQILRETLIGINNEGWGRVSDSMPIPLKGGRPACLFYFTNRRNMISLKKYGGDDPPLTIPNTTRAQNESKGYRDFHFSLFSI
jgi:hypothetical protein